MITEWSPAEAWRKDKASGKLTSSLRFGPRLKLVKLWRVVNSMKHKGLFGCPVFSSASSQISLNFCGEADRDVELSLKPSCLVTIYKHAVCSSISFTNSVCHALSTKGDEQLEGIHIQGALDKWRTSLTSIHPVYRFIMKTLLLLFSG